MPTHLVVLQPTSFCNINCKYCYLSERHLNNKMPLGRIRQIVEWLLDSKNLAPEITVSWHAGEPFVLPAKYFDEAFGAFALLECYGHSVHHSVQTNATLVREEHCAVLRRYRSNVGVSLDGPQRMHDQFRVTRRGEGTFGETIRGIKLMQRLGVPLSAIAVVGPQTFSEPDEFYACFQELQIAVVGINSQEIEGTNHSSYITDERYLAAYRSFLKRLFTLSCVEGSVAVRELIQAVSTIINARTPQVSSEAEAGRILSFSADGRISTFSPELLDQNHSRLGPLSFGSVDTLSFRSFVKQPEFRALCDEIREGVRRCKAECRYFNVCGGGAPSNKLGEHNRVDVTETQACRMSKKIVTDVALELFEERPELIECLWKTWWMRGHFLKESYSLQRSWVEA